MSIQRLPGDVAVQIKSSAAIASLNDAALGLLRNALDAGASRISIGLDYSRGGCTVEDNGSGIAAAEFAPDGGLGKLHHTSKYPPSASLHGRHGKFLASLAALSLLTIVSRHEDSEEQNALTMHNAKALRRDTPALPEQHLNNGTHGTRVEVRDLFGCMPVRARMRPLSSEPASWRRDWDSIVRAVVALLLAWPEGVTVTLRDGTGGAKRTLHTEESVHGRGEVARTTRLLSQAGLCQASDPPSTWVTVGASLPGLALSGCVCLVPAPSKNAQFIRIGIEPQDRERNESVLHDEINKIFAESTYGAPAVSEFIGADSVPGIRGPMDSFLRLSKPKRMAVDRWPVFNIGINLHDKSVDVDILDDRRQELAAIKGLLRTMLVEFLKKHGFYEGTTLPRAVEKYQTDGFATASISSSKKQKTKGTRSISNISSTKTSKALSRPLPSRSRNSHLSSSPFRSWPHTKRGLLSDKGLLKAIEGPTVNDLRHVAEIQPEAGGADEENSDSADEQDVTAGASNCSSESVADMDCHAAHSLTAEKLRISLSSLASAQVIGQVDRKFILIKAPVDEEKPGHLLILLDQHAADERCRVEALLSNYFLPLREGHVEANTTALAPPLQFDVDAHEQPLLARSQAYFKHWGLQYDILGASDSTSLLRVKALPASIAERCRQEPRLVIDLIRRKIWENHSEADIEVMSLDQDASPPWVTRLNGCPRGILDLVNSRACRSSIKFNDALTHEQCADLLSRLRCCAVPFQCAHGRPSMVPLLALDDTKEYRMCERN